MGEVFQVKIIYSDPLDDAYLNDFDSVRLPFDLSNNSNLKPCDVLIYGMDTFKKLFVDPIKFHSNLKLKKCILKCDYEGGFNLGIDKLNRRCDELKQALQCEVAIVTQNESLTKIDSKFKYLHRSWISPHAWWASAWPKEFLLDNFRLSDQPIFKFNYFIGTPRPDKDAMFDSLRDNNLLNDEICVWSKFGKGINLNPTKQVIEDKIGTVGYPRQAWLDRSNCQGKIDITHKGNKINLNEIHQSVGEFYTSLNNDLLNYNNVYSIHNSRFTLIQETEMQSSTNRYTEKTIKAIQTKQIFLLAGNYQTLKLLRKDGFKTFNSIIDESYDNIEDRDLRIQAITKEVQRLCLLSDKEWDDIYNSVETILNYNLNHLKNLHVKYKTELLNIINEPTI